MNGQMIKKGIDEWIQPYLLSSANVNSMIVRIMRAKLPQSCPTLCDPTDCSRQVPLSMEFSRQEYWRVAISSPRGTSWPRDPGIKRAPLTLPAFQASSLPLAPPGKPRQMHVWLQTQLSKEKAMWTGLLGKNQNARLKNRTATKISKKKRWSFPIPTLPGCRDMF